MQLFLPNACKVGVKHKLYCIRTIMQFVDQDSTILLIFLIMKRSDLMNDVNTIMIVTTTQSVWV